MSPPQKVPGPTPEPVFVARQPIYGPDGGIRAYELLFRHAKDSSTAEFPDPHYATASIIADGFALALTGVAPETRMFINFTEKLLLDKAPLALPKERVVVEILEDVNPTEELIEACRDIREEGYALALDDYVGQKNLEPLAEMADIIKVEVLGLTKPEIIKLTQKLKPMSKELLAEKVEDRDTYTLLRSLGYSMFQGYHFSRPEIIEGGKVSVTEQARIRLLQELGRSDMEVDDAVAAVSGDVSLSWRLLTFINSAHFSTAKEVGSISHAVAYLGLKPFRQWAMVITMSDFGGSPRAKELVFSSIFRGRFLTLLGKVMDNPPYNPDALFLLGMFSRLDGLLNQPMGAILARMALDPELRDGLLGKDNPAGNLLRFLAALEAGDFHKAWSILDHYEINRGKAAPLERRALEWTGKALDSLPARPRKT